MPNKYHNLMSRFRSQRDSYNSLVRDVYQTKHNREKAHLTYISTLNPIPITDIIPKLHITEASAKIFTDNVKHINIYTYDRSYNIAYIYNSVRYKFSIFPHDRRWVHIYKDGELDNKYNMFKEFSTLNFQRLIDNNVLDNYIRFVSDDSTLKLGLLLMAYKFMLDFELFPEIGSDKIRPIQDILCI